MLNAFTVDVEDYFHVSGFASIIRRSDWKDFPCRVVANTQRMLELLAVRNVRATFFVLGWVAHRYPQLVREIQAAGHEIGNHSYWHRLVYDLTPDAFRDDLLLANRVLEDITGEAVVAFRAPSFSITGRSLWALEILAAEGFRYDSSVFPIRHHRYGIPQAERLPHALRTPAGTLYEFPPSACQFGKLKLPVGGGYFRLYPAWLTRYCMHRINACYQPVMFYVHPWEIDPQQPRVGASRSSQFRHYVNLNRTETRLHRLLGMFRFGSMTDALSEFQRIASDGQTALDINCSDPSVTVLSAAS
jgi:polysaccharide deacetylase family protein (PEP-CTERM system associated)